MRCTKCGKSIHIKEPIKKGMVVSCVCGCVTKCLDINEYISRWKNISTFDVEDIEEN